MFSYEFFLQNTQTPTSVLRNLWAAFVPFRFKKPIRLKNDSTHDLSNAMGPPYFLTVRNDFFLPNYSPCTRN